MPSLPDLPSHHQTGDNGIVPSDSNRKQHHRGTAHENVARDFGHRDSSADRNAIVVRWLLSDWQPKFDIGSMTTVLMITGAICALIAFFALSTSNCIQQVAVRYDTRCPSSMTTCRIDLRITEAMPGPLAFYYRLTDFHQNTRMYSSAYSTAQVQSDEQMTYAPSTCGDKFGRSPVNGLIPYPCGLLPYSFFNDQFNISLMKADSGASMYLGNRYSMFPITWKHEMDKYYDRAIAISETRKIRRDGQVLNLPLLTDQAFQNWMKPGAHSTFLKLYRRLDLSLHKGDSFTVVVDNRFVHPISNGQKWFVLSTISWFGAPNPAIGALYAVVSGLLFLTAMALLALHWFVQPPTVSITRPTLSSVIRK